MTKPYIPDRFEPQISTMDAMRAAGVKMADLNNWVGRGERPLVGLDPGERVGSGRGVRFALTIATVLRLAIMVQLRELGITAKRASTAAFHFTHSSHGPIPGVYPPREPAGLYAEGWTYLILTRDRPDGDVINVTEKTHPFQLVHHLRGGAAAMLNLNEVVWQVTQALGFDRNGEPLTK